MKALVLAATLLALTPCVFSQCDSTITDSVDTPKTIRAKMACFADENAKLKQELAAAQRQPISVAAYTKIDYHLGLGDATARCKNRAIDSVLKRGGSVVGQDGTTVNMRLGANSVKIACNLDGINFVIMAGPTSDVSDLGRVLFDELFPDPPKFNP